jgi:hypothetical protein
VQDARQGGQKCAGCSDEVGTEVCTHPATATLGHPGRHWIRLTADLGTVIIDAMFKILDFRLRPAATT